ncbi:MAG: hypothetical protein CFE23_08315 [Flavobacterium sp. BFFFF1]|uniref:TolC family protein n=1 Tax=Flavobacterium sp. BFFFF1 TaxID=2015557 RepID=UPI000BD5BB1C|nr:TolC family protein [Flavobacterium sp. BFFFF1]OYU80713.1 MAG: hypothetical protein CFE23_08315 [Flavobacterium sp. BFFFF1]
MKKIVTVLLALTVNIVAAQIKFNNFNDVLVHVRQNNTTLEKDQLKIEQAHKAKIAAVVNVVNPLINNTMTYVDNIKLPVSVFPSEILGGTPGTYSEVETGIRYTNTINQNVELNLINFQAWENVRLTKWNELAVGLDSSLNKKSLFENINASYYNILTLQQQLRSTITNQVAADSLFKVATEKYMHGLVRQQDVNDSRVNYIATRENARQIAFLLENNILEFKILCDIRPDETIDFNDPVGQEPISEINVNENGLELSRQWALEQYALSNLNYQRKESLPTLSLIGSQSWQLFNNDFKVFDGRWVNSSYIGFKLSLPLPTSKSVGSLAKAKYEYQIAQKNTEQARIKSKNLSMQLKNDFDKTVSQYHTDEEIFYLRKDTYNKNKSLYAEGLIGMDQTLNSYNAMVNAEYSLTASRLNIKKLATKISINNDINQ